jgi:putative copper export protein
MISPTLDSIRIFLHLMAVAVWVGGQIVLAGIVPRLRAEKSPSLTSVAQGFARVAWPAMVVIVFTGAWGLGTIEVADKSTAYMATFGLKMLMVAAAVIATLIHSMGQSKAAKAIGGAVGLLASLAAAYGGILLAHVQ